jgi:predicted HicB family RNase H-like nuclease
MNDRGKTLHIPKELHTKLKLKAIKEDMSMKDYIIKVLKEKLKDEE